MVNNYTPLDFKKFNTENHTLTVFLLMAILTLSILAIVLFFVIIKRFNQYSNQTSPNINFESLEERQKNTNKVFVCYYQNNEISR